ncbi:MAG: hydroxymethylglutaryl-CoA lyase [Bacteroidetes bacterium]|jgi:hydroxymethylglutaryl-CoA lyase|nr:hydroxymethylglutaryl-CoA lyase [Bacteroidota bacterium]
MTIVECPRDAMQGIHQHIPTKIKAAYINKLLRVGFDTIDFGSFVSPRAVPQLSDTAQVLEMLELDGKTKLLAIVANARGAKDALALQGIDYLGYPFSLSETFQRRNTNRGMDAAWVDVQEIHSLCQAKGASLVVYLSMGFGNPYGDPWNVALVEYWADRFCSVGINTISLADTVGKAVPADVRYLFDQLIARFPTTVFGAHFHARPGRWREKIDAAYLAGCRRFDSTIKGFGGCPFAEDELVGNIATENLLMYLNDHEQPTGIDTKALGEAVLLSTKVFL